MIKLTALGKTEREFFVNPHQIEVMECVPDTTLTMLSGHVYVVKENYDEVIKKIVDYRKQIGGFKNEE